MSWQVEFGKVPRRQEGDGYWLLGIGDESVELEAPWGSVGGDPYPDLLRAVRGLCEGADRSTCSWMLEPGEYRWELVREGDDVEVRILDAGGTFDEVLFDRTCRLRELVRAVSAAVDSVGSEDVAFLKNWLVGGTSETAI